MSSTHIIGRPAATAIACDLVAQASYRAIAAEIPALRRSPGSLGEAPLPNGLLRHVDEQTVVGVAAVLKGVRDSGLDPGGFAGWSVLAAPRFLGRAKFEASFPQYQTERAWGVSPHLVPGHSLHSPSGTISLALRAHGANLGIGGTVGGEHDALLTAATFLEAGWAEGVWVVLSSRTPVERGETAVNEAGDYHALALALRPSRIEHSGMRLKIFPDAIEIESKREHAEDLAEIQTWLAASRPRTGRDWRWDQAHSPLSTKPHPRPVTDHDRHEIKREPS